MESIRVSTAGSVTTVTMNRPEVRNAFNSVLIRELTDVFCEPPSRIVVLRGAGPVFSAGGDLASMRESAALDEQGNLDQAKRMARMFQTIDEADAVTLAAVQGAALGGGMGLLSVCDVVIAEEGARFGFTEARLGLAPAVIAPFCIRKIGISAARRFFTTGERFSADEAMRVGLVHQAVPADALDNAAQTMAERVAAGGPQAVLACKRLVRDVAHVSREEAIEHTAGVIAGLRASEEGQEGIAAFLEKRKPNWIPA